MRGPSSRSRRELLKLAPLAAAGLLFSEDQRTTLLRTGLSLSDRISELAFRRGHLAPTFAAGDVTPIAQFPVNSYLVADPGIDLDEWRLEVSGLVRQPGEYSLDTIRRLPRQTQITQLICIEGWDVIGSFGGARIADLLDAVGAAEDARFIEVGCADDYYESIDIATARHPQSLLCYEMHGQPLAREHGAPLRLAMPTKLGYKQAKYLVSLKVTNVLGARRGYWEDQGYPWHGGL